MKDARPLRVGYATVRYHLFDLGEDLRRFAGFIVYGSVIALEITAIALAHFGGFDIPFGSGTVFFAVALVATLLNEPIRQRVSSAIHARMSHSSDRLRALGSAHAKRIAELRDPDESARILGETIREGIQAGWVSVFLAGKGGWRPAAVSGNGPLLSVRLAPMAARAAGQGDTVHLAREEIDSDDESVLRREGVEIIVPLRSVDQEIGVVLIAPSRRVLPYSSVELDFVRTVSLQTAISVDNARMADEFVFSERLATAGRVAVGLAHELGKPLRVVEDLVRRLPRKLDRRDLAERDLRRINALIQELLSTVYGFVKDARRAEVAGDEEVPLAEIIDRAVRHVERIHGPDRIGTSLAPRLPSLLGDEKVTRVLINLLDNAVLASAESETVHLFATADADEIRIEIVDKGVGMTPSVLQQAVELFFTTRRERGGNGVGLAISHEIVESLGGRLEIQSEPGQGTRARVRLPHLSGSLEKS